MALWGEVLEVRSLLSGPTSILGQLTGTVTIQGNLDVPGELDTYTFTVKDDSQVYFDSLTNNANFNWSLTGPAGHTVPSRSFTGSDGTAFANPVLDLVAGSYTLTVSAGGNGFGAYGFRLLDLETAALLTLNADVSGTLVGGNTTNACQFTASAGDSYSFSSVATTAATNDVWRLVDPFGDIVASQPLNTNLGTVTLIASGTYTLLTEGSIFNSNDATYTIHDSFLGNTPPVISGMPLTLGTVVNGTLATVNQKDAYTFSLASNAQLYFDSLTNSANFNWSLSGPAGTTVSGRSFTNSDGPNFSTPVLGLVAGDYTLTVAGATTGAYSFRLSDLAGATALTPGTAINGTLVGGNTTDLYQFTATAGQSFYFANQVTSGGGTEVSRLVDPYGNILFSQSLSGNAGRFTLNTPGNYSLLIEGSVQNTVDVGYTLNVLQVVDPAPQALALGSAITKTLAVSGQKDTYSFSLVSNSLLYFDSLTNNANFNWSLAGPAGSAVSGRLFTASDGLNLNDPVLNLVAGNYTLTVSGAGATTGAYSFRLSDLAAGTALTPGTAVNGTLLGGNSTSLYQFTATAGQTYYLANQVTSGSGGPNDRLRLVDPFGNIVFSQTLVSDAGRFTLSSTGKYTLLFEGDISNTGDLVYTVNVFSNVDPAPQALTLGSTVAANLAVSTERDTYTFTLASNSLLYFDSLTNSNNFNWSLSGPAGSAVTNLSFIASDGLNNSNPVLKLVAGNYTLTVAATGTTTGAYIFRLSDMAAATPLTPGTPVNGTLAGGNGTDLYQLTATAGQAYYFANQVTSGSGGANDRLRLVDPFGNILFSQTLPVDAGRVTLNATGKYTLLVE
ncbi:MAG TPA: hypothetical protein VGH74_04160, partial [Planctomycetaceae bacterium]